MPKNNLHERVENDFTLHPPTQLQGEKLDLLRQLFKELAHSVVDICPESREQSLALTELDSASRWAIAAIIRERV